MIERSFHEKEVTFQGEYTLSGTLTIPDEAEKVPVILFIHGSGPVDRNSNVKQLHMNIFNQLAHFFARKGFASFRYDKRGVGKSEGSFFRTGFWDLVKDAESAIQFLKTQKEIDPHNIILLGHSEGCMIAPAVHQRTPVNGIIFLSGACESLRDTVLRQGEQVSKELVALPGIKGKIVRALKLQNLLEKQQKKLLQKAINSDKEVLRAGISKFNAKWLREHFSYDVRTYLPAITCPILAVTGSKDSQVNPADVLEFVSATNGNSQYDIIQDMNHVLRKQNEIPSVLELHKIYKKSALHPIDEELLNVLHVWLHHNYF